MRVVHEEASILLYISVYLNSPLLTPILYPATQDHLKVGFIISITARSTNSLLKVASNGMVECSGALKQSPDLDCQFEVVGPAGAAQPRAIRLRSVAYPQFYLAIVNGYFIGDVSFCNISVLLQYKLWGGRLKVT